MKLVAISGSLAPHSRTAEVLAAAVARADRVWNVRAQLLDLRQHALEFCDGRPLDGYRPDTVAVVRQVADADALLVGTPIYRGTYSGALKNLVDLLPNEPMRGKVVGLVGNGASLHHALALDHTLRPLFAFFHAVIVPEGVYLTPDDFRQDGSQTPAARERLAALVDSVIRVTRSTRGGA